MSDSGQHDDRHARGRPWGLRGLMLVVVDFALGSMLLRPAVATGEPDDIAKVVSWVGLNLTLLGAYLVPRLIHLKLAGWGIVFLGLCLSFGGLLGGYGVAVAAAVMIGIAVAQARRGSADAEALLWTMAIAARHGMPLAPGVAAFAEQCGRRTRARVLSLAERLEAGVSLPDALRSVDRIVPVEGVIAAGVGLETGTLAESLGEAAGRIATRRASTAPIVRRVQYLAVVTTVIQSIMLYLGFVVMPQLRGVFSSFEVPLPEVSQALMSAGSTYVAMGISAAITLICQWILIVSVVLPLFRRASGNSPFGTILDPDRHRVTVLRALARAADAGRPFQEMVGALRRWYPHRAVRSRLDLVEQGLGRGGDWIMLLQSTRLVKASDAAVLESAARADNIAWALRTLADRKERRFANRLELWMQVLFPLALASLGLCILALGLTWFLPLARLLEVLSTP